MHIIGIIPARYASTRLPGKPLLQLGTQSMIERVYKQVSQVSVIQELCVATDDARIFEAVKAFGGNVVMTSPTHPSGTDRCYEAYQLLNTKAEVILNIQGDEPFIKVAQLEELAHLFLQKEVQIGTLVKQIEQTKDLFNPNIPKVCIDQTGKALYFSRQTIPFIRGVATANWLEQHVFYKHIGLYGFRSEVLAQLVQLPISALEAAECLEQLRWLEHGFMIHTATTSHENLAIDTPEDLEKAHHFLKQNPSYYE